jgi:acyl carrier protein
MSDRLPGIRRCMQTVLRLSDEDAARIGPETTPIVIAGWNSLAHVQIILELERTFDVTFDADTIASLASVGAMIAALERPRT